jgi:LuxR family maltose regulon positive regulatory protein
VPDQTFQSNVSLLRGNQIYLERPRIDRLLERAIQNQVIIVCAGAGYGKTHAVYSFVRKYNVLTSWIQFSERDNIDDRFWENFTAGISLLSKETAVKLSEVGFPDTKRQYERYLSIPLKETHSHGKNIFVYDDFHLIQDKAVLRFIERSISSPFSNITSILICRTEPSINLTKLLSKGLLGRIGEEDLRFSREEMTDYFRLQNISPSAQAISSIYHDTEGWAFAIHLAGLSLKNAPPDAPYVPQAMRTNIFRLIEGEIMSSVSPELRKFLIKLSIIDHLPPELLQEIAALASPGRRKSLVEEMEKISSFIRFDTYLNAYHIHHLLLEYLSRKQDELDEEEKGEVYEKAAKWCAENNQKLDAINYYEKAGNYDRIIALCSTLPMMLSNRTARMMLELLDKAPPLIYEKNPLIYTHRIRILMSLGMIAQAEKETLETISRFEAMPLSSLVHQILTICYANKGFIRIMVSLYTGDYDFTADFERCAYHGGLNNGYGIPLPLSVLNIGSYVCRVTNPEKGEMERYINALAAIVPLSAGALRGMEWGADTLARTELAYFKGDIPEAEQFAMLTVQQAREWDQWEVENRALFYLLRIFLARGNHEAILGIFRQLEAQLDQVHYINRFTYYDIVTGWYYSQIGRTDKVAPWLKNDFEGSDLNSMNIGLEVLVKAKCHLAEKRYPAALAALAIMETRKNQYDSGDFVLGKISLRSLEAVCRYQNRDKEGAFAALETAYSLARPNDLYMPFTELGKDMRALVAAALKDKVSGLPQNWLEKIRISAAAYAKKLFTVAEQYRPVPSSQSSPVQGMNLSHREIEVLTSLSQGMTREEIAGFSSLSANTIKSVIRSAYNKLGAVNKADAIRIAAAMEILKTKDVNP